MKDRDEVKETIDEEEAYFDIDIDVGVCSVDYYDYKKYNADADEDEDDDFETPSKNRQRLLTQQMPSTPLSFKSALATPSSTKRSRKHHVLKKPAAEIQHQQQQHQEVREQDAVLMRSTTPVVNHADTSNFKISKYENEERKEVYEQTKAPNADAESIVKSYCKTLNQQQRAPSQH